MSVAHHLNASADTNYLLPDNVLAYNISVATINSTDGNHLKREYK